MTPNFSIHELTKSQTAKRLGIDNTPNATDMENLQRLAINVLQPAREVLGMPLQITSGYRSPELNKAVGGAINSSHMRGEAADMVCANNAKLFHFIKNNLMFDQLIWEKGNNQQPAWVHVSFSKNKNRNQTLKL